MRLQVPDLRREALELLLQIPKGKVTTYHALAVALGDEAAARAVGQIMAANDQPERFPCYKVVHSSGEVGAYSAPGGSAAKIAKLRAEGIEIQDGRIVGLHRYLFTDFKSSRPLEQLRALQEELSAAISLEPLPKEPKTVAGVDVAYGRGEGERERAVAGYALLDLAGRAVGFETVEREVAFPYIPTYLAFRELPILLELLERVRGVGKLADVVMVDGNGILHPRHAGIASHLGVLLDIPTIGITKSLLCGQVELAGLGVREVRYVLLSGERVGAAVRLSERAQPIFISPGNKIDLEGAIELTLPLASSSHRLPEPIRLAHELCSAAAQQGREGRREEGKQMALGL
ncbi:MAG: endonuclease V [Candidatus Acetothermia bacterium]|nr:endonuclease V [Candidatus Acetothermia bacterium]MDH7504648.1 endonuclease V [Candidatus Acetothermia bacterium]